MNDHTLEELTKSLGATAQLLYDEALEKWKADGWSVYAHLPSVTPERDGRHTGEVKYTMTKEGHNPAEPHAIFQYSPPAPMQKGRWVERRRYRLGGGLD